MWKESRLIESTSPFSKPIKFFMITKKDILFEILFFYIKFLTSFLWKEGKFIDFFVKFTEEKLEIQFKTMTNPFG